MRASDVCRTPRRARRNRIKSMSEEVGYCICWCDLRWSIAAQVLLAVFRCGFVIQSTSNNSIFQWINNLGSSNTSLVRHSEYRACNGMAVFVVSRWKKKVNCCWWGYFVWSLNSFDSAQWYEVIGRNSVDSSQVSCSNDSSIIRLSIFIQHSSIQAANLGKRCRSSTSGWRYGQTGVEKVSLWRRSFGKQEIRRL